MGQSASAPAVRPEDASSLRNFADERMEEELVLRNVQFTQKRAVEVAERREQFAWELMAAGTLTMLLFFAGSVYKRKDLVIPIAPLIMGIGYRYDAAYGTQESQVREQAEALLRQDPKRFEPLAGAISLAQLDAFRQQKL